MRVFGKGFNFSQDGPGNRLVYHLSGCNMRCIWCSGADSFDPEGGREYAPEDMIAECVRSRAMFFDGGGVTFTGGEATLWHDELLTVLKGLKEKDIHTAIETNGTSPRLFELLPYIDYLIMDFKHFDSEKLLFYTGMKNEQIKENFELLCRSGRQMHIRIPLINGINTADPEGFASYFSSFDTSHAVFEFLPYHEYGKDKWKGKYQVKDGFVRESDLKKFYETFDRYGLVTVRT